MATSTVTKRLISVSDYHQMAASGIFSANEKVELLEGEVYKMSPIGARHASVVDKLNRFFSGQKHIIVRVQNPIRLNDFSEPEPDIAILKPNKTFYADAHPQPHHVLLLIEVADTTLQYDRDQKMKAYARASIIEYWLIDLGTNQVKVYQHPQSEGATYKTSTTFKSGDTLSPGQLPHCQFSVEDML